MNRDNINTDALYVLKKSTNERFYTEYVKIDKQLKEELEYESLYEYLFSSPENVQISNEELYELRKKAVLDFFEKIYKNHKELFGYRNFCSRCALRSSYSRYVGPISHSDITIMSESDPKNHYYMSISCNGGPYYPFYWFMNDFFDSYFIEKTYEKCEWDKDAMAFSHRRVGWTTYNYNLNETLAVEISTNFSFGSASYFVITLIFNGIKIVPYSRLVLYYYANAIQLIRHTREYEVYDSSWQLAFDFLRDASNDFLENGENSFIAKYVVTECEKLIELLPKYLDTDVFYLSENLHGHYFYYEDRFKEIKLEGYPLIIFRGEKVSGATNFVSSLQELDKIITTKKYIDCIVDCCIKLLPELEAKENEIVAYLDQLNMRIDTEKENCTNLENEISTLTDQKELEEHRDELKNLLKEKKEIYDELIKSYRTHYQYSVHIKKYKDDIDFYLKSIEAVMEPQE